MRNRERMRAGRRVSLEFLRSVTPKKRAKGADVWEFRYYETQADGMRKRKATFVGTTNQYKNRSDARVAVEALLLKRNEEKRQHHLGAATFGGIIDRYIEEELPELFPLGSPICRTPSCISVRGGSGTSFHQIRPMVIESWLKHLNTAPKSKAHIRGVMHVPFELAARWKLFNDRRNPIQMVWVKASRKSKAVSEERDKQEERCLDFASTVAPDSSGAALSQGR